nr:shikimate kinase [Clostridia bacterium]
MKGVFGLLGEKLGHSFSPRIHAELGDYAYSLFEVAKEDLPRFMTEKDFDGINVTIPYKKAVMPFLDEISKKAESIGCVNTVKKREDGTLYGDNTDYDGFMYLIKGLGVDITGKKAIVLGSGGASLTARTVLKEAGAGEIRIISRSGEDNYENISRNQDAEIIVNTTPVGMYPGNGESLIDLSMFRDLKGVIDVIYNPLRTKLILDAMDLGIPCINGLPMLVAQAKRASEIFQDTTIPDSEVERILSKMIFETENIILIGMPGSGKSSVGKNLASMLGREQIDCDRELVERAGMSIPEFFSRFGEGEFRILETEILKELSKKTGKIISTGGGVVTRAENRDLLRQNGTVVFIDRPLNELSVKGRPISLSRPLEELAEERMDSYISWSGFRVSCEGARNKAEEIIRHLKGE